VGASELSWAFAPAEAWRAGEYALVALASLEDTAGNRIGRPFDVDRFDQVDQSAEPERFVVRFQVE
jgi:hypothetical protein